MIGNNTNHLNKIKIVSLKLYFKIALWRCLIDITESMESSLHSVRTHGRIGRDQIIHSDTNQYIVAVPMLGSIPISYVVEVGYFHIEH